MFKIVDKDIYDLLINRSEQLDDVMEEWRETIEINRDLLNLNKGVLEDNKKLIERNEELIERDKELTRDVKILLDSLNDISKEKESQATTTDGECENCDFRYNCSLYKGE